jgi:hypothetical protein
MNKRIDRPLRTYPHQPTPAVDQGLFCPINPELNSKFDSKFRNKINPGCDRDHYYSVDHHGKVYCRLTHHHSHEVNLDREVIKPPTHKSNEPIVPHCPANKNHVWQVSYELVQFIFSENVSLHD